MGTIGKWWENNMKQVIAAVFLRIILYYWEYNFILSYTMRKSFFIYLGIN